MEQFVPALALIGIVIVVASLLSGAVEKAGVPLVAVFLALGAALGPWGLGLLDVKLDSPALRTLSTLALVLVLFSDAVTIDTKEVRARARLVSRLLGPGTLVPAALIALAAWLLLGVPAPAAAILGAALASTDPVLLRSVLRSRALPTTPRIALRLESGMNDVILLPIVVLGMLLLRDGAAGGASAGASEIGRHVLGLFVLGPALGILIGWVGIVLLARVRQSPGVRRDYESLYALGLAFTSYAAAEAVGGSGFLAAFGAGFVIASQDVELCDCFLEYGEATGEMLLLFTFVALGTSLIWTGLTIIDARTLLFAVIALFARTVVLLPMLEGVGLSTRDRRLIALFGPRGLSSLLFTLLPVFAGVPGAARLFTVTCLVVLLSVVLHGVGIALYLRAKSAAPEGGATAPPAARTGAPLPILGEAPSVSATEIPERIELADALDLMQRGEPFVLVDARADRSYGADPRQALGAIRLPPDDPVRSATEQRLSQRATLLVYCA